MPEKECMKCGEIKPLSEFYKHKGMKDGHVNKCKGCNKTDVRTNYSKNKDYYHDYDRKREQTTKRKDDKAKSRIKHRMSNPEKYRARTSVGNALRDGRLKRLPCRDCGDKIVEGHHDDYSKPLEVIWLCKRHHVELQNNLK